MANDHEELVALFRYSVISEAVGRYLSPTERGLVVRALASRAWASPEGEEHCYSRSTLDRWIAAYHRDGLAGLSPVRRADKGTGRVSPELMAEAVRLRRAVPTRSAAQITDIIARAHGVLLSERTVRAHLARSGVSRRELTSEPARAFGRFEASRRSPHCAPVCCGPGSLNATACQKIRSFRRPPATGSAAMPSNTG